MGEVQIYTAADQQVQVEVTFDRDTVWLTQKQMALLFDKDTDTIGLHIRNILKEGELQEAATTEENSVVQQEGNRRVKRKVRFYNLDMILSVGYRVNSKKGTQFRQWATQRLKEHLVQGYTLNEKRLQQQLFLLQSAVQRIGQLASHPGFPSDETKGLLTVISQYARSFHLLNQYDTNTLDTENLSENITHEIGYEEALTLNPFPFGSTAIFNNSTPQQLNPIYRTTNLKTVL